MAVTESAREHLFATISQQYEPQDAETLKALLMSPTVNDLATKQDLAAFATRQDLAELRGEFAEFRAEFHEAMHQQTRTYISWMFGLLTAYTAMIGSALAVAAVIIH